MTALPMGRAHALPPAPRRVRVAFQGAPGAFSEDAIAAIWRGAAEPVPMRSVGDAVRAAERGQVDAAIVPVENLIAGAIEASRRALAAAPALRVVGEAVVDVRQCLLALPGATLSRLETVESHPVALAQCTRFLERHAHLRARSTWDTAGAARDVAAAGDARRAAIAGRAAGERYGLAVLAEGIENLPGNHTRFVAVSSAPDLAGRDGLPPDPASAPEELARLRRDIDRVDDAIVRLVGERLRLALRIGAIKRGAGLPVRDRAREERVLHRVAGLARQWGIRADIVQDVFQPLLRLSRRVQKEG